MQCLSEDACSKVSRWNSLGARSDKVVRQTGDANYEWGDKLEIMDMGNSF